MESVIEYLDSTTADNIAELPAADLAPPTADLASPTPTAELAPPTTDLAPPTPTPELAPPGTQLNPHYIDDRAIFTTYHTLTVSHLGWTPTSTRTIFARPLTPRTAITLRGGRSIPPSLDAVDWNVWTVGNMDIGCTAGGLHLDYLREVLRRRDGNSRKRWTKGRLERGVDEERMRQFREGVMVDRPVGWERGKGWWVYVQPL